MSYRTVKRLLGETSLERKSRYLFGGSLLLLITASFYVYATLTSDLVYEQNPKQAQNLVFASILEKHFEKLEPADTLAGMKLMISDMRKPSNLDYNYRFFRIDAKRGNALSSDPEFRPSDSEDYDAIDAIVRGASEHHRIDKERGEYQYFAGITAEKTCATCHRDSVPGDSNIKVGDLMRVVKITLPLKGTREAVARNNAILLATAIGTAFLAMLAAYAIVRYVIVKPVLHLKDVSDQVARQSRATGRHPHRRRVRRTEPRLQPHVAAPGGRAGRAPRGEHGSRREGRSARPGQPAALRNEQAQGRFSGDDEP